MIKEKLPNHSIARLLRQPNEWQTSAEYFGDLASTLVRHGRFLAFKAQGTTGPIMSLSPIIPTEVEIKQNDDFSLMFKREGREIPTKKIHYIRGPAVDFVKGDSPVENIRTAIGIEIACEEFGATFFNNGALPLLMFSYAQGFGGFKTPEEEKQFIIDFQNAFAGGKRNRAMLVPRGIEIPKSNDIGNDKAQFLETRKFYQTVIAGAWGVPPHLVGNLENGHYNNVEQQDKDFTLNVIMPYIKAIESAMERDLLTAQDRSNGIVIRFNMDSVLRASFEERQAGLQTQFQNGVINQDEWREIEGKNPKPDGSGKEFYYSANLIKEGEEPPNRQPSQPDQANEQTDNDSTGNQSTQ